MVKFCLDIDAYLASQNVQRMDAAEERGYFRLLMAAKTIQETSDYGPGLPDDDEELAGLSLLGPQWFKPTAEESKRVGKLTSGEKLRKCFAARVASKPGVLFNRRMLKDWSRTRDGKEARSSAGRKAANARWSDKPVRVASTPLAAASAVAAIDEIRMDEQQNKVVTVGTPCKSHANRIEIASQSHSDRMQNDAEVQLTTLPVNDLRGEIANEIASIACESHSNRINQVGEVQLRTFPVNGLQEQIANTFASREMPDGNRIKSEVPFELTPFAVNGLAGNNGHSKMANRISSISDFEIEKKESSKERKDYIYSPSKNTLNLDSVTNTENLRTDITSSEQRVRTRSTTASKLPPLADWQIPYFDRFWSGYWRRVAKLDAQTAFGKAATSIEQAEAVISGMEAQCAEMLQREVEVRPHAATWLHKKRWNDELAIREKIIAPQRPNRRDAIRQGAMEIFRREKAAGRAW